MSNDSNCIRLRLLRVATTHEIPVVTSLAIAAGIFWRCLYPSCGAINNEDEGLCARCMRAKTQRP